MLGLNVLAEILLMLAQQKSLLKWKFAQSAILFIPGKKKW